MSAPASELTLGLPDGSRIAVKMWGDEHAPTRILLLHGWLDSSATWDLLAPLLVRALPFPVRLIGMDFTGHGLSSHRSKDAAYTLAERVVEVHQVVRVLGWNKTSSGAQSSRGFSMISHSMGAAIASLFAATFPELVEKLVLVDMVGPMPFPGSVVKQLRVATKGRVRLLRRQRRVYPTFESAVQRYLERNKEMKPESARLLLSRSLEEVEIAGEGEGGDGDGAVRETGYCWRHDPRLTGSSAHSYSIEQGLEFVSRIKAPTLVFLATNDARRKNADKPQGKWWRKLVEPRLQAMEDVTVEFVEGSHHLHLDCAEEMLPTIVDFFVDPARLPRRGKPQWAARQSKL